MPSNDHITINELPDSERPRERLLTYGPESLSSIELLAIILRTGSKNENVLQLAARILAQFGSLQDLCRITPQELIQVKGLGQAKAAQILAALELGRRSSMIQADSRPRIHNARDAAQLLSDMGRLIQEQVRVVLLDTSGRVIAIPTIYIGTVNMSILRISELFREAITRNSPAIIIAHNHPSGDASPSPEDVELTRGLIEAGKLLDIQVIDHIIIGGQSWRSMREMGLGFTAQY